MRSPAGETPTLPELILWPNANSARQGLGILDE
jgi:hypothetical protein